MAKRLYRSERSKVIAGVCGGLGEYFAIDPVFLRIIMVLLVFANGIGLIAYIVCWIAMPRQPEDSVVAEAKPPAQWHLYLPGLILIVVGVVFLFDQFFWWFSWRYVWPVLLIAAGVALIWRSGTKDTAEKQEEANESVES